MIGVGVESVTFGQELRSNPHFSKGQGLCGCLELFGINWAGNGVSWRLVEHLSGCGVGSLHSEWHHHHRRHHHHPHHRLCDRAGIQIIWPPYSHSQSLSTLPVRRPFCRIPCLLFLRPKSGQGQLFESDLWVLFSYHFMPKESKERTGY